MPLMNDPHIEPFSYNEQWQVTGSNPLYDKFAQRLERPINYGPKVSKAEATASAMGEIQRGAPATPFGTITLTTDPEEGSRFDIRPGHNILVRYFNFFDPGVLFHVTSVSIDFESLTVTLTVDTKARDRMSLSAVKSRDRETQNPQNQKNPTRRHSYNTKDVRAIWDCESGAGILPPHGIEAGLWNVLRVAGGEEGDIARIEYELATEARFCVAVFDRPITPAIIITQLQTLYGNPLLRTPGDQNPWDLFPDSSGLINAWGGPDTAIGFYPYRGPDDPISGKFRENANFHFKSSMPPWLWVAEWCEVTTIISGRLFPATEFA